MTDQEQFLSFTIRSVFKMVPPESISGWKTKMRKSCWKESNFRALRTSSYQLQMCCSTTNGVVSQPAVRHQIRHLSAMPKPLMSKCSCKLETSCLFKTTGWSTSRLSMWRSGQKPQNLFWELALTLPAQCCKMLNVVNYIIIKQMLVWSLSHWWL